MDQGQVLQAVSTLQLAKVDFVSWDSIPFANDVRRMCEMNTCGNYGTNWMCPPAIGDFEELRDSLTGYRHILMIEQLRPLKDSFDYDGMQAAKSALSDTLFQIKELLEEQGSEDVLLLGAGGCRICERCNYPLGEPCRHPERALPSVEGYGIHIVGLCNNNGFRTNNGPNTVTNIGLVFYN